MKTMHRHLLLYVLVASVLVNTTIGFVGFMQQFYDYLMSAERCDPEWIAFNAKGLEADLEQKLFGQHIVLQVIVKTVSGFMSNHNPKKPLVLSLHGPTGTGKNLVSKLLAENIYKKGMNSRFVHLFTSQLHFPHRSQIETYMSQLQQWIKGNVTNRAQSMFIFDEMDKMQPGLIDGIKPFLDYYDHLDQVSYRKAIFIFLSNDGWDSISETALHFWREGKEREEIELKDLETSIALSGFNNKGSGFSLADLIDKNLVDFFIPFLPLEYKHVILCVFAAMEARGMKPKRHVADKLARDLGYFPKFERVFSSSGCKKVWNRIHFFL